MVVDRNRARCVLPLRPSRRIPQEVPMHARHRTIPALTILMCLLIPCLESSGSEKAKRKRESVIRSFGTGSASGFGAMAAPAMMRMEISSGSVHMGATVGGAKDITYARSAVSQGQIPHPNVFAPEGLFSEHDLPLDANAACSQLFCATGGAIAGSLIVQPDVRYLAQLGFSSNLTPSTFKRAPLNLIATIDKSGSMSGHPIDLVKESLLQVLEQLGPDDRVGIVLYGDRSYVHLPPTPVVHKSAIQKAIQAIESSGSTYMEEGLKVGFDLARQSKRGFAGTTRVMLFTDERPNVGRTDAQSFMGMAQAASKDGIGMTTIGMGVQFGAEMATQVSSVRGGNLYFFSDINRMKKVFTEEFDTLVTELAYDLRVTVKPARGLKIVGIYGVPGSMVRRDPDGGLGFDVATIFLSRKNGAIYVALAIDGGTGLGEAPRLAGETLLEAHLAYTGAQGGAHTSDATLTLVDASTAPLGLQRGRVLVDEVTALKQATALFHEKNDQDGAFQIVHAVASLLRQTLDADLAGERKFTSELENQLAQRSGHAGEPTAQRRRDPVSGMPE